MFPDDDAAADLPDPDSPFPDLSENATMEQLAPYNDQLYEIFVNAVKTFNQIPPELQLPLLRWKRTHANCIWAYMMVELDKAFPPGSPVKLKEEYGSITIIFNDNLIGRLKKMSPDGFTANYQTKRVKAYHSGDQGELFRLIWSKPLRVDIGYLLNETGTGVDRVMVARRKAPKFMDWVSQIAAPESPSVAALITQKPAKKEPARVRAKNKATTDVQKES